MGMGIGIPEIVVIAIVALVVIGPDKMPEYARKFGKALKSFRAATADLNKEVQENIIEPLNEAQKPLREAIAPLQETADQINQNLKDVKSSMRSIGDTKKVPVRATDVLPASEKEAGWTCSHCGTINHGKFCSECGERKVIEENTASNNTEQVNDTKSEGEAV